MTTYTAVAKFVRDHLANATESISGKWPLRNNGPGKELASLGSAIEREQRPHPPPHTVKALLKVAADAIATIIVFPAASLALFGRSHKGFVFGAQTFAFAPGIVGSYLRVAYYHLTLDRFPRRGHIAFGSFFAHPQASVGDGIAIGSYCILGKVDIGSRTLIASHVQILSGRHQHTRDAQGRLTDNGTLRRLKIGSNCWIGASAVIMADVGENATVGAGSVVVKDVPDGATVVGNPARNVRRASGAFAGTR